MNTTTDIETLCRSRAHHLSGKRFQNPWSPHDHRRMHRELLRWYLSPNPDGWEKRLSHGPHVATPSFSSIESEGEDYVIWLGHATVYVRLGGVHFITDPVFGGIMGRFERRSSSPVQPRDLPGLDVVLISHNHIDHVDTSSLRALRRRFDPVIVTGLGHRRLMSRLGFRRVVELDWWEERHVSALDVFCLPVQHWSRRGVGDCDRSLWCGFDLGSNGRKLVFVGDSGYFRGFSEIGVKRGPYDLAILPIGAYKPRRLCAPQHMDPVEAYEAATDLRAAALLPTHWGTFGLGAEPLDAPPEVLIDTATRAFMGWKGSDSPSPRLEILDPGEPLFLRDITSQSVGRR